MKRHIAFSLGAAIVLLLNMAVPRDAAATTQNGVIGGDIVAAPSQNIGSDGLNFTTRTEEFGASIAPNQIQPILDGPAVGLPETGSTLLLLALAAVPLLTLRGSRKTRAS